MNKQEIEEYILLKTKFEIYDFEEYYNSYTITFKYLNYYVAFIVYKHLLELSQDSSVYLDDLLQKAAQELGRRIFFK